MQTYLAITSTLSTLALAALVTLPLLPNAAPRPTWDYKIAAPSDFLFDTQMSALGSEGWEVVTCRRAMGSDEDRTAAYECIFKRLR
jgi:hypothetical protein